MAVLTTPTTQTVYGSIIDQSNFQRTGVYSTTSPAIYLTRILSRMMAAAYSPNLVLSGLNVISTTGLNTDTVTFTLSPGSMIIDSMMIYFNSNTTISTDQIPPTAPNKLRVGIFASYTFNIANAESVANDVTFSSYLFDMNDNLIAPTIFLGGEKILITSFIIDMTGSNLTALMQIPNWSNLTNGSVHYIGNGVELRNSNTVGAEISRTITGLVNGEVYRVQMLGYGYSQLLIGSLLTATSIVDSTFTANSTNVVVTLRVNSNVIGASAKFIGIKMFIDNVHNARTITPSNGKASNGDLKALSVNNLSKAFRTEITVAGHGTFKVKGDSRINIAVDQAALNVIDVSVASWVLDIPKIRPTSTTLAYNITDVLL